MRWSRNRGQLIRSLSDDINAEHRRMSDLIIAGILTLLLIDVPTTPSVFTNDAREILNRIHKFSPDQWAESKFASPAEWVLLGNIHQVAVDACFDQPYNFAMNMSLDDGGLR
ncbi:hypothetical protein BDV32DRAFT_155837 [Aspergillus pseudonomiae]|uniref:Uncharacterized protein n=1 Tax=Aspergillus pseudonomiae TaxID=1506151 RepID=A0A5N7DFB1_9EURO|nr:uncharacterized protein BDV37DRAFT_282327 [Aspergillus pseudonomiae]KAB8253777.1 hypothetical protein BDV32DRAFT_155837 [Aspergillus pseudonomiae]KAE8405090.1 hypothetical protein BDV37DRAFT_282327 [Aspergillus pseudonomiae]